MRKRKTNAIIDKNNGEVFINADTVIELVKLITKSCVRDFTAKRNDWIQERLDNDYNIDVRFERDYTKKCAKNMKIVGKAIANHFAEKNKELKEEQ